MKKIPSVFKRNYDGDYLCYDEVVPGCEWVLAGEGIATRKFDGTPVMHRDGKWYSRYDNKAGRTPPEGWEPAQDTPDEVTGHWPGWVEITPAWSFYKPLQEATKIELPNVTYVQNWDNGTYELCGPKIQGNPDRFEGHVVIRHGTPTLWDYPADEVFTYSIKNRSFEGLKGFLSAHNIEGVVFHHPDGRMAKVKRTDFGFEWAGKKSKR